MFVCVLVELTVCFHDCEIVRLSNWLVDWLVDRSVVCLCVRVFRCYPSAGCLIACSIACLPACLFVRLFVYVCLFASLSISSFVCVFNWLVGWLVGCLLVCLFAHFPFFVYGLLASLHARLLA